MLSHYTHKVDETYFNFYFNLYVDFKKRLLRVPLYFHFSYLDNDRDTVRKSFLPPWYPSQTISYTGGYTAKQPMRHFLLYQYKALRSLIPTLYLLFRSFQHLNTDLQGSAAERIFTEWLSDH